MKLYQGPGWYGEFNRGCSSLQDEFRKDRSKSVAVPKTMILQDRHVTYRETETILAVSGTSIRSIRVAKVFR